MKKLLRFIILPIILCGGVILYYKTYQDNTLGSTAGEIKFIKEHINSKGELVDFNDEIAVDAIEDVKLFVTDKEIKIQFGELGLTWKPENFVKEENLKMLGSIGITAYKDKETGKLRVFYKDEEVKRWVS